MEAGRTPGFCLQEESLAFSPPTGEVTPPHPILSHVAPAYLMGEVKPLKLFTAGRWKVCTLNSTTAGSAQALSSDKAQFASLVRCRAASRAGVFSTGNSIPPSQGLQDRLSL